MAQLAGTVSRTKAFYEVIAFSNRERRPSTRAAVIVVTAVGLRPPFVTTTTAFHSQLDCRSAGAAGSPDNRTDSMSDSRAMALQVEARTEPDPESPIFWLRCAPSRTVFGLS